MLEDLLKPDDHFTFDELRLILTEENRRMPEHETDLPLNEGTIRTWMSKLGIRQEANGYYCLLSLVCLVCWIRSRDNLRSIKTIPPLLKEKPNVREELERELRTRYGKQTDRPISVNTAN